ncbi:hypothetical protein [Cohnella caldifontis]|uniref:hypothetical protein n=1 Tax=Cohnella caldifontis TaxID=3027471 RepID=UPI0023EA86C2|nr:hypothetical protein [Cohnella sp. YIM B05605]
MWRKYGLEMRLPQGKLPGFYAQIVKGIAERAELFDRHKELLVLNSGEDADAVEEFLRRYGVEAEACALLAAPAASVSGSGRLEDFAVAAREGHVLFDLAYVAAFRLTEERPEAESAPALMQLAEHVIAEIRKDGEVWHVIERQLRELAERVARAYGCEARWFETDPL